MTLKKVCVITDNKESLESLCSGGRQLGGQVTAVIFGSEKQAQEAVAFGADLVYFIENHQAIPEACSKSIAELLQKEKPELVLVYASVSGKLLAGKIAARLGTAVVPNVSEIRLENGDIIVKYMVYGGTAIRTEKSLSEVTVAVVGTGVFKPLPKNETREGQIVKMDPEVEISGIRVLETRSKQGESVNLSAAKRVVGVGRGFNSKEDLSMAEELAKVVGAELACTRPIAEGEKWMSKERYVGVSGVILKPELYLALGVSGQIQHMIGVNQAKTIVAVNKDKNAPIFKQADIGIVGDLYTVVPKIIERIKG